jgi:predicted lactoylglutathione lyase
VSFLINKKTLKEFIMKFYRGRLLDHINVKVRNIQRSKQFYRPVIEALGHSLSQEEIDSFCIDELLITEADPLESQSIHLAFQAQSPAVVKLFHQTALANGGRCHGAPGAKPLIQGYSAWVLDPDGNILEAIYHGPVTKSAAYIEVSPSFR